MKSHSASILRLSPASHTNCMSWGVTSALGVTVAVFSFAVALFDFTMAVFGFAVGVFGFALISSCLAWYRCGIRCYCTLVPDVGVVKCLGSRAWPPLSSWASQLTLFFHRFFFGITSVEHRFWVSPAASGQVFWNALRDSNVSVPSRVSGVC